MLGVGINYGIARRRYLMSVAKKRKEKEKELVKHVHDESVKFKKSLWDKKNETKGEYFVPTD